ncbi:MAG: hypothetical protein U0R21_00910 [Nocardioidaceae bacterium]
MSELLYRPARAAKADALELIGAKKKAPSLRRRVRYGKIAPRLTLAAQTWWDARTGCSTRARSKCRQH